MSTRKCFSVTILLAVVFLLTGCQESNEAKYNRAQQLLSNGKYDDAIKVFDEISTYEDSSKMSMYAKAIKAGENGDYETAYSGFAALGDYKDCQMMIVYYAARNHEANASTSYWRPWISAAETYDTIALFLDSKDRSERCRKAVYDGAVASAEKGDYSESIRMLDALGKYSDSTSLSKYYAAFKLEQDGKIYEAADAFAELAYYKDSSEQVDAVFQRCYDKAASLEANGDQLGAYDLFTYLGDYKDSYERAYKPYYDMGVEQKNARQWELAIYAFEKALNYKDAKDQLNDTKYLQAIELEENGSSEKAHLIYVSLGNYKDSFERAYKPSYDLGLKYVEEHKWEDAVAAFERAGTYSDARTQISETKYLQAKYLMSLGSYADAVDVFNTIKGYKDVNSLLEKDENLSFIVARTKKQKLFQTTDQIVTFGTYPQEGSESDKSAIEWQVLDYDEKNRKSLLLCRYGIDAQPFDNVEQSGATWERCSLRRWLNQYFFEHAFDTNEQSAILITDVDNGPDQGYSGWDASGGANTQDKVFLLSYAEAKKYLSVTYSYSSMQNSKAQVIPTKYAIARGAVTQGWMRGPDTGRWWLRSPGKASGGAAHVSFNGAPDSLNKSFGNACVRPAIWVEVVR